MGGDARHFHGVLQALFAGAGVGVAGIDDDGPGGSFPDALNTNLHRRGANLVGRKHAGNRRRHLRHNQRQIAFLPLVRALARAEAFDVAKHAAGEKALGRDDGA